MSKKRLALCPICGKYHTVIDGYVVFPHFSCYRDDSVFILEEVWNNRPLEDTLNSHIAAVEQELAAVTQERDALKETQGIKDHKLELLEDFLEHVGLWLYKQQGNPLPLWEDEFQEVCQMMEPVYGGEES
jgi:hypothetical protein